ncbi:hypothetical protein [Candidatus Nitrosopumilus sediminis]|uniref:Uncharacterized protein n=1 Tax=Candidatus Nitrosopumilus sediminis TaxID=1229909 RepID=K0BF44_9ARCH|nr:hypothetical protein [Candidatus Nitrosopumilus sediminis]AFS82896.1 hypothetical protein NSED_05470 [Candidatus Nitrosopumilus sediminis]
MKLRYKITIVIIAIGILIPASFLPINNLSVYLANQEYISNLPTVDVIGVVEFEKNGSMGFDYKLYLETESQNELKVERVFLEYENINQDFVGQEIRVIGNFEKDYQGYMMLRGSDFSKLEITPVIFIKEIEILN